MDDGTPTEVSAAKPVLLCLSHLRWDFVHQRPQHLLSLAARTHAVVFWEEPESAAPGTPATLRRWLTQEGVEVVRPMLPDSLDEAERDAAQRVLIDEFVTGRTNIAVCWFYTPMAMAFAAHLEAAVTVYDCMDELASFAGASPRLLLLERRLLRKADLVFTGGRSLFRAKQPLHANVHCFPSAVDCSHFAAARLASPEPDDQAAIGHPRIGYFGVLDERLDTELVAAVADLRPDWQIVLLGPVAKIAEEDLPRRPNVHWLGGKSYTALPSYLAGWDAGLMPFARNDATRFISPTKTPEYLAAGIPLVSTPVADVVAQWGESGIVSIAENPQDVVDALQAALEQPRTPWLEQVDAALSGISWEHTWAGMQALIGQRLVGGKATGSLGNGIHRPAKADLTRRQHHDWLVVGAGFAGTVLAERIARERNETVLVVDRRPHVGGNAYDCLDAAGVLIHQYGPHIFHTNAQIVVDYLSRFTDWRPYEHRVLADVDGMRVPIPINLDTINRLYNLDLTSDELESWFAQRAEPVADIRTSEDVIVARVGRELYAKFFQGYTQKQWGLDPSQLDRAVTARVPVRCNRDDRYFTDSFQAMPADGYTAMFERMLDHPNITLRLGEDYSQVRGDGNHRSTIWTGPIDEFFGFIHGHLPYRSLRFKHETLSQEWLQPVGVINFPQTEDYTRITEYKHLTGQKHAQTSISYEYPSAEGDPYYPVPRPENAEIYRKYRVLADATRNTWFAGRLATYQYMNMDQVVAQALTTFRRIEEAVPRRGRAEIIGAAATKERTASPIVTA